MPLRHRIRHLLFLQLGGMHFRVSPSYMYVIARLNASTFHDREFRKTTVGFKLPVTFKCQFVPPQARRFNI